MQEQNRKILSSGNQLRVSTASAPPLMVLGERKLNTNSMVVNSHSQQQLIQAPVVAYKSVVTVTTADTTIGENEENSKNKAHQTQSNLNSQKPGSQRKVTKRQTKAQKRKEEEKTLPVIKHHHSVKKPQTPSVSRRNARERNRVQSVNIGFATLKNHIPNLKSKTSKVDTLRAAVEYIQALRSLVGEDTSRDLNSSSPISIAAMDDDEELDESEIMDESRPESKMSAVSALASKPFDTKALFTFGNSSSPERSLSSLSNDINPMVYQLPPALTSSTAEYLPTSTLSSPESWWLSTAVVANSNQQQQSQHLPESTTTE